MTSSNEHALLPTGLSDRLPPDAGFEAEIREALVAHFVQHGFDRVKPPLIEFEDHLLAGTGAGMTSQTFRLMDPVSQRMLGVRADMTPQVARLATTRLAHFERPLRLCYSGEVLRTRGTQLRPERQFTQAGAEIVGTRSAEADAEMIVMAAAALQDVGISEIKVDLCQPLLATAIIDSLDMDETTTARLRHALDRKDAAEVEVLSLHVGHGVFEPLSALLSATGPAQDVIKFLKDIHLSGKADAARNSLLEVVSLVQAAAPELAVTIDAVENRGFEYHSGVTFTLFATGVRGELGSGGRYTAGHSEDQVAEPAVGFTLFLDSILRALSPPTGSPLIYLPYGSGNDIAKQLHAEGYRTLKGYKDNTRIDDKARALGCTHIWQDGNIVAT